MKADDVRHDWQAECRGLAYMILQIQADYLQAKEHLGGDSEILDSAITQFAKYVVGPLREKVDAAALIDGSGSAL